MNCVSKTDKLKKKKGRLSNAFTFLCSFLSLGYTFSVGVLTLSPSASIIYIYIPLEYTYMSDDSMATFP